MIKYLIRDNKVVAEFDYATSQFYGWSTDICNYLCKKYIGNKNNLRSNITRIVVSELKLTNFSGTAKCSPQDIFNIEIGKTIARKRLLDKYNKQVTKIEKKVVHWLNNIEYVKSVNMSRKEYKASMEEIRDVVSMSKLLQKLMEDKYV